jgi:hypothetical protein
LFFYEVRGCRTFKGHILLKCFSEHLSLEILPIWQFCSPKQEYLLPGSQVLSHGRRRSNTSNRSEVINIANFGEELINKEIYQKMAVRLSLIRSNCVSHRGCTDTFKLL